MSVPSQPNVTNPGHGAFVASRDDAPAYWFYGTLWVVLADVHQTTGKAGDSIWIPRGTDHGFTTTDEGAHVLNGYAPGGVEQIIVGLATPAARRELTRMNNNYWSASSDSGWSKIAPQR